MITSASIRHLAFGSLEDGDPRSDSDARIAFSRHLDIPAEWATVSQVHGNRVAMVDHAGSFGAGDALVTGVSGVPMAIATADCLPIAIDGDVSTAIVHAGWRGIAAGVIEESLAAMRSLGDEPRTVVIGPHIMACCYEVGDEVITAVGGFASRTRGGSQSVDLAAAAASRVGGCEVEVIAICTRDDDRFASHRRNATAKRQVAVAWR